MGLNFDPLSARFASARRVIYGRRGMVCASQPLAAQAGLDILRRGGNAIDAAIAAAACLTVLEPTSNGLGGDAFALIWSGGRLHGLNSSGPAPRLADPDFLRERFGRIPERGWYAVDVPGIPAAWAEASRRFGRLSLAEALSPAIAYAEEGYPLSPVTSRLWAQAFSLYSREEERELFASWFETFAPKGRAPLAGELAYLPDHAASLRELARTDCESFYRGELAARIDEHSRKTGGWLRAEDLAAFRPEWVEPLSVEYRGCTVHELPPTGHGLAALLALGILSGLELGPRSAEGCHLQIEAMKLGFADALRYVAELRCMELAPAELLDGAYLAARRGLICETALEPEPGDPRSGGTVYLCAADGEGNMVSWIQSNYMGFGSGVVVPGTGVALHNRGCNFSLDPASRNCMAPGKRPYHTIIPGFLTKGGRPVGPFGVMGAFMQPQGHVQVVSNTLDFLMNPQEALDAPRWQWTGGRRIELEPAFPSDFAAELRRRGHEVTVGDPINFGRGQIIWRDEQGVLCGGTEPRADGCVAAW